MDYTQALEVLNNLRSVLYEKGEITVTPKVYRQVEAAIHEVEEKISLLQDQNNELATEITHLTTERDQLRHVEMIGKKVKKKK